MKTIISLFFSLLCVIGLSQNPSGKTQLIKKQPLLSQTANSILPVSEPCGTDYIRNEAFKQDPQLKVNFNQNIQNIKTYIANNSSSRAATSQYRIPVVVHVIHNGEPLGTGANISDAQIQSQINRLNSSFDNIGGGTNSVFTDITFCLAQNGPNGSSVTWPGLAGVNRLQDAQTHAGLSAASQANLMSVINWPSNQYLNIWVVSTINGSYTGVIGYAPQPLTGGPLDGVVIQANVFGDNAGGGTYSLLSGYDWGMTMVHEAGHYLGLYHTFQGASCTQTNCNTQGDLICDTPPTSIGSTCTTPICTGAQVENYMDYTLDVCKNTYTLGQKNWMQATIATMRSNLVSPANLTLTGVPCAPAGLLATFTQSASQICESGTVTFTATTTANTATSFIWTFPGGTPSTATGVGPHIITYASAGDYDVILETNDGTNNLINTSVDAVNVVDCSAGITGAQAQWYFQRRCAVDFTSGVPVGFIGSLTTNRSEGAASVSDASGNLEFYTDGLQAWDGTGSITSSLRTLNPGNESPAQGAVIVPDPNNLNNYYVFSNPGVESTINQGVRYSLYEGATQDFPTIINQPPTTNYRVTEHLAAAPHCNGTDYWVIYHGGEAGVNDKFLAYQLSASGVSATPVISNAFSVPITPSGNDWIGQIDIAPNGRLMAATNIMSSDLYIYEIDRATGQITFLTSTPYSGGYGVSFSPNSEFLYVAGGTELRQYNVNKLLECGSSVNFKTLNMTPTSFPFKSLQAGPDGKIYINRTFESWLDVLNYPNQEITTLNPNAIGYNDYAVFLPSTLTTGSKISLPNMIDVPLGLTNADFDFCITNCGDVDFHNLGCGNTFSWDFGDMNTSTLENPSHTYSGPGTYTVTFTSTTNLAAGGTNSSTVTKTININIPATPSIVGPQLVDCPTPVNQFAQYTPSPFDPSLDYYWTVTGGVLVGSNPTDIAYVDWSGSGSIKLVVIDPITGCTDSTSINVCCKSDSSCCTPVIPTNLNCNVSKSGIQTLTWATSPGLTYQVEIIYNDPFCVPGGTASAPVIFNVSGGSYTVNVSPVTGCLSWRVRSICPDGTTSAWTAKQCCCKVIPSCTPIIPTKLNCNVSKSGIQTLTWATSPGLTYQVEIIYNDPFCVPGGTASAPVIFNVSGGSYTVNVSPVTGCLSWRVRSICPDGTTSAWTAKQCCCKVIPSCTPIIPTNLNCNVSKSGIQTLTWATSPGLTYQVEIIYNDPFCVKGGTASAPVIFNVSGGSYTVNVSPVTGCLSWRVRSICPDGTTSAWTAKQCCCKVIPSCTPIIPTKLNCNVSKSGIQTLTWATSPGLTYQVEIIYNDPFCVKGGTASAPVIFNVSGGSYTVNVSPVTGCLSWRVRSICPDGTTSAWTAKQCCCKVIPSCTPIIPTNLNCNVSKSGIQTLTWATSPGLTYQVEIIYNDPFCVKGGTASAPVIFNVSGGSYTVNVSPVTGCLSWRVRSICPDGTTSAWTAKQCCCKVIPSCTPIIPTNLNCNVSKSGIQTLTWATSPGLTYQVEIIYNDPFCVKGGTASAPVIFNVSGGSYTVNVSPVTGCLSWRVRSICPDGTTSAWTAKQCCCKVIPSCTPIIPTNLNCNVSKSGIQTLTWATSPGLTYQVEIIYNDPFCVKGGTASAPVIFNVSGGSYTVNVSPVTGCLSWRVRSICPDGTTSAWTAKQCCCKVIPSCTPIIPTNLNCNVSKSGIQTLTWATSPGLTYQVEIIYNDPFCVKGGTASAPVIFNVSGGSYTVNVSPVTGCLSWRVRSICPDGTTSAWTVKQCCCKVIPSCKPIVPTNLKCISSAFGQTLTWDNIIGRTYEVEITYGTYDPLFKCCRPLSLSPLPTIISTTTNSIFMNTSKCFTWRVRSVCTDGTKSNWSGAKCSCYKSIIADPDGGRTKIGINNGNLENSQDMKILLAPNPVTDITVFDVRTSGTNQELGMVYITSLTGELVFNSQIKLNGKSILDLSNLESGTYLYKVESDGAFKSGRIVVID